MVRKANLNFIVDSLAFVAFLFLTATGVIMHFLLPPGSGHHTTIWTWDRHDWGAFHFWVSVAFLASLALHLILHWKWILNMIRGKKRDGSGVRAGLGLIGTLALIAIAFAPALSPVKKGATTEHGNPLRKGDPATVQGEAEIRGSSTLEEVERISGVPATYILEKLGLPEDTPKNARFRDLKDEYGFEMETVRKVVAEYGN
jgi:hypothetical protein